MSVVLDSLCNDEFEIIDNDEDESFENESEPWTLQQSIKIEPPQFQVPEEISIDPPQEAAPENQQLDDSLNTKLESFSGMMGEETLADTPVLADSVRREESLVQESAMSTLGNIERINDTMTSDSESVLDVEEIESTERALRNSLAIIDQLKNQLKAQASKIANLEQNAAINEQLAKLTYETLQKENASIKIDYDECLKNMELTLVNETEQFKLENAKYQEEAKENQQCIQELKQQLAAANQCVELWKNNAEKKNGFEYSNENVIEKMISDNDELRSRLDEEIARRYEEQDLRKMAENRLKSYESGQSSCFDPPAAMIAKQLSDKTDHALRLEHEISSLREQIKELQNEAITKTEIVSVLSEDQLESTRILAAREHKISELEKLCRRHAINDSDFAQ